MTTLSYERGASDTGSISVLRPQLRELETIAAERGLLSDANIRIKLARAHVDIEALSLYVAQQVSSRPAGMTPALKARSSCCGPEPPSTRCTSHLMC